MLCFTVNETLQSTVRLRTGLQTLSALSHHVLHSRGDYKLPVVSQSHCLWVLELFFLGVIVMFFGDFGSRVFATSCNYIILLDTGKKLAFFFHITC